MASASASRKRIGAAQFLLEQPGRGGFGLALERVAADEFGEVGGLVRGGGAHGAHLVEVNFAAEAGGLERRFGASEASTDDLDALCHTFCQGIPFSPMFGLGSREPLSSSDRRPEIAMAIKGECMTRCIVLLR